MTTRVLVVAEDPLARAGLAALLSAEDTLVVAGRSAPDEDLPAAVEALQPDVIAWDLGWQGENGLARLAESSLGAPVVALVSEEADAWAALEASAAGALRRNADGPRIAAGLVAAAANMIVVDAEYARTVRARRATPLPPDAPRSEEEPPLLEELTSRELEVLRLLAEGLPNKTIAQRLDVSEHTVKFHVNSLLGKLGAASRTEAVVRADPARADPPLTPPTPSRFIRFSPHRSGDAPHFSPVYHAPIKTGGGQLMASEVLTAFSDALAAAVETAGPSIVRVEGRRRLPATGIVWSADGLIVTAHHVVEQDENIGIGLADGRTVTATLAGRDPATDLALLRVPAEGLGAAVPATWADGSALKVGHMAMALGRPGQSVMATLGIVSALKKDWRTPAGGQLDYYLQTDALMYPGFSGGPLVDVTGRFIGLNTSAMLRDVTLTIPAGTIRRVAAALAAHGRVKRGYLGVGAQTVRLPKPVAEQVGQATGLLLGSVEPDSPAERSGLFMGDTLLSLDGVRTTHLDDLLGALSGDRVGKTVPSQVLRGGQVTEVTVTVGEQ